MQGRPYRSPSFLRVPLSRSSSDPQDRVVLPLLLAWVCPLAVAYLVAKRAHRRRIGEDTRLEGWHLIGQLAILVVQSAPLLWWEHGIDSWIVLGFYFWPPAAAVSFSLMIFYWSYASDRT